MNPSRSRFTSILQNSLLLALAVDFGLVISGKWIAPGASPVSLVAPVSILLVYTLLILLVPLALERIDTRILRLGTVFGLSAGAVFAVEIILEYVFLPTDNTIYGYVEFGLVFCLFFVSGLLAALPTRSMWQALLTALSAAIIASLIWDIAVLVIFYAFRGTPQQALVFQAEGNYADFARSGMADFTTFIVEDFMGATFFHLLLGPLVAAILGLMAGLVGKIVSKYHPLTPS